jgi:hypothetical protein
VSSQEVGGHRLGGLAGTVLTRTAFTVHSSRPFPPHSPLRPSTPCRSRPSGASSRAPALPSRMIGRNDERVVGSTVQPPSSVAPGRPSHSQHSGGSYFCAIQYTALLVGTGAGRYPIEVLCVKLEGHDDGTMETLLRTVRGVGMLELHEGRLDLDWLCGRNLQGEW